MSEYQYYEFRAIDRQLDRAAMDDLRALSSRAEITSTRFTNEYSYGDFKGSPNKLMEKYFDVHLYLANWGTHQLALRVPVGLLPLAAVEPYTTEEGLNAWATKTHTIIDFRSESEEGDGWIEGDGWLKPLLPVREELLAGDMRPLYLGWLATLESSLWEGDESATEPPVPPGLGKLTAAQKEFANFLRIDPDLIEAAAEASARGAAVPAGPSASELAAWVAKLPDAEKNAALVQLLEGEGAAVVVDLRTRFRADAARSRPKDTATADPTRRTVKELFAVRDELAKKNRLAATEKKAKEAARLKREQEEARTRRVDSLVGKETNLWREVETAIEMKQAKQYDRAIELLKDLRDLANRAGTLTEFAQRIRTLREKHSSKSAFKQRLNAAEMPA